VAVSPTFTEPYPTTPGVPRINPPSRRVHHPDPTVRLASRANRRPKATCPVCGLPDANSIGDGSDLEAVAESVGTDGVLCLAHPYARRGARQRWAVVVGPLVNEAPDGWVLHRVVGEVEDGSGLVARVLQLRPRPLQDRLADVRERAARRRERRVALPGQFDLGEALWTTPVYRPTTWWRFR
jgi:hypothetical protein